MNSNGESGLHLEFLQAFMSVILEFSRVLSKYI